MSVKFTKIFFNKYYNINVIDEKMSDTNKDNITMNNDNSNKSQLNKILFGPPGSGKTYNTINRALEIVGVDINEKSRKEIKELFDKKIEENRIVFTTFHQSMSYEDFIEGIKPKLEEGESDLSFEIKDSMCGFRVYPLESTIKVLNSAKFQPRMGFDSEILVRLKWENTQFINVPTPVVYPEQGISHFHVWRDNLGLSKAHATLFVGMLIRLPKLLKQKLQG